MWVFNPLTVTKWTWNFDSNGHFQLNRLCWLNKSQLVSQQYLFNSKDESSDQNRQAGEKWVVLTAGSRNSEQNSQDQEKTGKTLNAKMSGDTMFTHSLQWLLFVTEPRGNWSLWRTLANAPPISLKVQISLVVDSVVKESSQIVKHADYSLQRTELTSLKIMPLFVYFLLIIGKRIFNKKRDGSRNQVPSVEFSLQRAAGIFLWISSCTS